MARAVLGATLAAGLLLGACAKKPLAEGSGLVLAAPPADLPIRLGIDFDGRVTLVGAKLEPATGLKPGSRAQLTLYWQKQGAIERGFRLFTHVLDEAGERVINLDGIGELRKAVADVPVAPPSAWQEGRTYVDQQAFTVPATLRTDSISVVAGLFRDGERLPIKSGPHLGDRGLVAKLPIARPIAASSVASIWVPHRKKGWEIVIDGKLDEPSWGGAAFTQQFSNVATGEPQTGAGVTGNVRLVYDDISLFVGIEVADEDVRGGFDPQQADPHLWTKDTVEVMIDPDGDGDNLDYYEIQVGPQNLVFDSQFDSYNQPKQEPNGPYGHQEWSAQLRSGVTVRGTLDDAREDDGYVVEMAIPWASFSKAKRVPPQPQDVWRMNFYVVQGNDGAAWSPILGQGNFHRASRFGHVHFGK